MKLYMLNNEDVSYFSLSYSQKAKARKIRDIVVYELEAEFWFSHLWRMLENIYYMWQMTTPFIGLYNKQKYGHYYILHELLDNEVAYYRYPIDEKPFLGLYLQTSLPVKINFKIGG